MFRGLYTATSGMQLEQKRLDVTSNNIANVNTTAFKRDVIISEAFPEVLMKKINGSLPAEPISANGYLEVSRDGETYSVTTDKGFFIVDSPKGISYSRDLSFALDENGYLRTYGRDIDGRVDTSEGNFILDSQRQRIQVDNNELDISQEGQLTSGGAQAANLLYRPDRDVIGIINSGRRFEKTQYNFTQGILEETGNSFDFAIEGRGFFRVITPDGEEMYTRNGNFFVNQNNEVVNEEGYFLAGIEGSIVIDGDDFYLGNNGEVIVDGEIVEEIDMINILNLKDLNKIGHAYYVLKEGAQAEEAPFEGQIIQGYLEGSNINTVNEMVQMINTMRAYESNSKVLRAYDEILQRAVNEIGKV